MKVMASEFTSRLKLLALPWKSSAGMDSKVLCKIVTLSGLREFEKSHNFLVFASVIRMLDVQSILISCLEALEHFHRVIRRAHFDVKPTNILLTEAKTRNLCDFSNSRNPHSVTILEGTFEYMPAELFHGKVSNFSVDVYSLAITFIQFICRRHPYMSSVEMNESEDRRRELLKVRTQQDVPITGVQIGVSALIIQTLGAMSETKLKTRPLPVLVLQLLRVEHLEQQVAQLEREKQSLIADKQTLRGEKQALMAENRRLQESEAHA